MRKDLDEKIKRIFGSKKVFAVYLACWAITILTMVGTIILAFVLGEYEIEKMLEHLFLCVISIILLHVPMILRTRFQLRIPAWIQIVVTIFIVAHFILGEIYRFYDYLFLFDKILHITAGIVIAVCGFSIVYSFSKTKAGFIRLSPFFVALFSFSFTLALLVLWEVYEYSADSLLGTNMQRWQDWFKQPFIPDVSYIVNYSQGAGLIDTMTDLVVGIIGAFGVCVIGWGALRVYPDSTKFYIIREKTILEKEKDLERKELLRLSNFEKQNVLKEIVKLINEGNAEAEEISKSLLAVIESLETA